jgi:membrane associated rhomboid family serine protease
LHIFTNAGSLVPTIGASGAIACIMGAYFRFFPHARVETVIPPFFLGPVFVLPAVLFLGWWFFLQFFNGTLSLGARGQGFSGIAWWAHVGGFGFGFVVALFVRKRPVHHLALEQE